MRYGLLFGMLLGLLGAGLRGWAQQAAPACPVIPLPANGLVVAEQTGDVTGDGTADRVFLVGIFTALGDFAQQHQVLILNGQSGAALTFPLGTGSGGYDGTLFLGRFNPDRVPDIFVGIPTGGSGGISQYYLLTAAGGTASFLIPPARLTSGPPLQISLLEHYRARVVVPSSGRTFTLDLRQVPASVLQQTYRNVYSPTGRLLRPTTGTADPYGVLDPVDTDRDGLYELIGYQSLWVLFHANTIGEARSVWRWTPNGLAVSSVTVLPQYSPESYRQELQRLTTLAPATAVPRAIARYQQRFPLAPPAWRDAAFTNFRIFHQGIINRANQQYQRQTPANATAVQLRQRAAQFNADPANRAAGLEAVHVGEGYWQLTPRQDFYTTTFAPSLTADYRDYLALEDTEIHQPFALDGELTLSLTALSQRLRAWEQYLERYAASPFRDEASGYYQTELDAFLYGIDNTPHFREGVLRPGVADVLRRYATRYPSTASGRQTAAVLALYQRANFQLSAALQAQVQQYQQRHDPQSAAAYFPLEVGTTWVYTGGFENAGYRIVARYRADDRVQFNTISTATQGISIYALRDDMVVMTYQAAEAGTEENRLSTPSNRNLVVLQGPIRAGRAWVSEGIRHAIAADTATRTVLGRTYINVIEVVRTPQPPGATPYEIHDYYALGVGLIAREYRSAGGVSQEMLCSFQPADMPPA